MQKLVTAAALAAAALLLCASTASAVPIAAGSELSINGSDQFTPTTISFANPANVGGTSGSFTALANCSGCVTMDAALFTAGSVGTVLYDAVEGAISSTLTTTAAPLFTFTPGTPLESLMVTGPGVLTLTGFDPTPGAYDLTTQGPGGPVQVTFSVTSVAEAVPEPGSLALLGTALAGLGLFSRRRRQQILPGE